MNDSKNPLKILFGTVNELVDSKKWIGSYVATIVAAVLVVYFGLSAEVALLIVSPIVAGVAAQAHVDAKTAQAKGTPPIEGVGGNVTVLQPAAAPSQGGFARVGMMLMIVTLGFVVACGASGRERMLRSSLVAVNVASDTFLAVSAKREKQIVDDCNPPTCTKDEGHAKLDAFRALTQPAVEAISTAYRAISVAALGSGPESVSEATHAAAAAIAAVKELGQ